MKKIIFLFLLISLSFTGCDLLFNMIILNRNNSQKLYNPGFPEMETFEDVANYIASHVYPKDDDVDISSSPEETLKRGYGDCEDIAILFMNIAHFTLGVDFGFAAVLAYQYTERTIGIGGDIDHIVVILNGQLYSTFTGKKITEYKASYYYSFYEIFSI